MIRYLTAYLSTPVFSVTVSKLVSLNITTCEVFFPREQLNTYKGLYAQKYDVPTHRCARQQDQHMSFHRSNLKQYEIRVSPWSRTMSGVVVL